MNYLKWLWADLGKEDRCLTFVPKDYFP